MYKPRRSCDGCASQWSISSKKDCVFLEMAKQCGKTEDGNAKFDWDKKISFKLGDSDIGEILSVLNGMKPAVGPFDSQKGKHKGLFHSNQNGNSVLYFGKDDQGVLRIHLSVKRSDQPNICVASHNITIGESCILKTILERAVVVCYNWN